MLKGYLLTINSVHKVLHKEEQKSRPLLLLRHGLVFEQIDLDRHLLADITKLL